MTHQTIPYHGKISRANERGFSLVIVLLFVSVLATIIALSMQSRHGAVTRDQARAAGWHLAQVAKAARIYVRDRSIDPSDPTHIYRKLNPARPRGMDAQISIGMLIDAGLLPSNFPDTNILGQEVIVYAGLYPPDGDPAEPDTVSTAYVMVNPGSETTHDPSLLQYVAEGAQKHGLYINAPLFGDEVDSDGFRNIVTRCEGTDAVSTWDTDCLSISDFSTITGLSDYHAGGLLVPAWKAYVPDTRAVMRFPQPEKDGYATMLTSLEMAPVDREENGNCRSTILVQSTDEDGRTESVDSGVCESGNDESGGPAPADPDDPAYILSRDHRKDIINVSSIRVDSIVAVPQNNGSESAGGPSESAFRYDTGGGIIKKDEERSIDDHPAEVFQITGNLETEGNIVATGRMHDSTLPLAQIYFADPDGDLIVRNSIRIKKNMSIGKTADINTAIITHDLTHTGSSEVTVDGQLDAREVKAIEEESPLTITGVGTSPSETALVAQTLQAGSAPINVKSADLFGTVEIISDLNVTQDSRGNGAPALVVYKAEGGGNMEANRMTTEGSIVVGGELDAQGETSIRRCVGRCPYITPEKPDGGLD